MPNKSSPGALPLVISYAAFVSLGLPMAAFGVSWPYIRETFGLTHDAQGILVTVMTVGSLCASFSSGRLIARMGAGRFLFLGCILGGLGLVGMSLVPTWWLAVALSVFLGMGGGTLNAGVNVFVAMHYRAGPMNWLHASYGIGATLGPMLMTAVVEAESMTWQTGYLVMGLLRVGLALVLLLTLDRWQLDRSARVQEASAASGANPRVQDTLHLPEVWFGIASFIALMGTMGSVSNWGYSLFTEARAMDPVQAGQWMTIYWGGLTVARIVLGPAVDRLGAARSMRLSMIGGVAGAVLLWWNPGEAVSFIGLVGMGIALATVFPTLIAETPRRVGQAHAPNTIGFQIAASDIAGALLASGLAGVLAERLGLEAVAAFILVSAILMLAIYEASRRWRWTRSAATI